jgi:hypothetical protein
MSVTLISFCSFLSGVGSCAAFQAALKTGISSNPGYRASANDFSDPELAHASRIRNSMSSGSVWIECIFLHTRCGTRIPR